VIQLALIAWTFSSARFSYSIVTGIADSQLALAVVILAASGVRWSLKLTVALGLVGAAWLAHYICLVELCYPFVFTEEYLISLLVASSIGVSFFLGRRFGNSRLTIENSPAALTFRAGRQFAIRDLLIWTLVIGTLITIGKRAIVLTDVSGMSDPWEKLEFSIAAAPDFFVPRIPLLLVSLVAHGIAWTLATKAMLGTPWSCFRPIGAVIVLSLLSLSEVVIAAGMLLFDKPWPLLPVSEVPAVMLAMDIGEAVRMATWHDSDRIWDFMLFLATIFLTRVVVFGGSLLLLRGAGWRLVKRTQPTDGHSAEHASPPEAAAI
jgi:hypothetical protein